MQRMSIAPRNDWQSIVESQGFLFHTTPDCPYWDESAYYLMTRREVEEIERATHVLNEHCLAAIDYFFEAELYDRFQIPRPYGHWLKESWERDERTVYGRFDFAVDGQRPPALLEYNADTPTSLLEAAVVQWYWYKDLERRSERLGGSLDQFNCIHERLIDAWQSFAPSIEGVLTFSSADSSQSVEDYMTAEYLRDTAMQAGLQTQFLSVDDIGWNENQRAFMDLLNHPIQSMFKLYPWEWMIREQFGRNLVVADIRWFEPPWKMILSNKALLPTLYELFPECPYILRAELEPFGETYVQKPILSREGANVSIVHKGQTMLSTEGYYGDFPTIYQQFRPLPNFDHHFPVVGSWIVNGYACGMGIRESESLITTNTSRFVPHVFAR